MPTNCFIPQVVQTTNLGWGRRPNNGTARAPCSNACLVYSRASIDKIVMLLLNSTILIARTKSANPEN